jgi:NAD(P) transhydrogenase
VNGAGLATSAILALCFATPSIHDSWFGTIALLSNIKIWGMLGTNMVLPIGGADMPVVVSLLNAFSGLATSASGFMLSNNLLTITGALVTSSGWLLSDIMCRGINRSMLNVLLGGFGTDGSAAVAVAGAPAGEVQEVSAHGMLGLLLQAKRICIVPGYGLAVARCQNRLAEIVALLRSKGVTVHFAIHPVAGRLPGHMNVLLAEANVPYDIVKEMDEINTDISRYDLSLIIGANDIVNPATQSDPSSPIYGMPAIEVWQSQTVVVMKRSMGTGYSGVDNPLFYRDNVHMLFGDAKQTIDNLHSLLEESQDQIRGAGGGSNGGGIEEGSSSQAVVEESFPVPRHTVGVIRERRPGERRVSISPMLVPKLRRMGFSILLEAGAGQSAGFVDADYLARGGVQVAESAREVLQQADVVLKVNEPLPEEVQFLKGTQVMIGFWSMLKTEDLHGDAPLQQRILENVLITQLKQTPATFVNLSLVPRISRAQKLDALTSMANIAGYRAVLDAFNRLPRFSRSSVTASGTVPPAKVFIIGAGIAGLSAIATANAMGAKVLANDVRNAAREQVQGMGAEFVAIDAETIAGEGAGGYASEMSRDFKERQLATYARVVKDCDIVIATAMIPNRMAPVVITRQMISTMRKGSVIVDLAAPTGGNCELTQADQVVTSSNGVTILAETNYPAQMPGVASDMIGSNFVALLEVLGGGTDDFNTAARWEDPVIVPATVVRGGKLLWNPPDPTAQAAAPPPVAEGDAQALPMVRQPTQNEDVKAAIEWIEAHREELAWGVGLSTVIGLGLVCDVPEEEITHLGYFVLSLLIGHFTVSGVQPALHTPLVSVTNAISGIIVVGGMLQLSGPVASAKVACALSAVFLSSINIVGGFAVTHRMLEMFRTEEKEQK